MVDVVSYYTDNYAYAITSSRGSLLFDCGDSKSIVRYCTENRIVPSALFITHFHRDHASGIRVLRRKFPDMIVCSVKSSKQEMAEIEELFGVRVILSPGHTLDHCCFFIPEEQALITGDTLFAGGCGRCFSGEFMLFSESLKRLAELPAETKSYPGHEYLASNYRFLTALGELSPFYEQRLSTEPLPSVGIAIGDELRWNALFRAAAQGNVGEFVRLRKMKDTF